MGQNLISFILSYLSCSFNIFRNGRISFHLQEREFIYFLPVLCYNILPSGRRRGHLIEIPSSGGTSMSTYKLISVDYLDLPGTEVWLEEMAAQGLFVEHLGSSFARFRRDKPARVCYRVEAENSDPAKQEEYDFIMAEKGWEFVCTVKGARCCVYMSEDADTPGVPADPFLQARNLKKLVRHEFIASLVSYAVLLAALVFAVFSALQSDLALRLVEESSVYRLLFPLVALLGIYGSIITNMRLRDLHAIEKELSAGLPFRREGRTTKTNFPARLFTPILVLLLALSTTLQVYSVARSWEKPLAEADLPFSMPAITELTGDAELDADPVFTSELLAQYYNRGEYDWLPLSEIYKADRFATAKEGAEEYRFVAKLYRLRLPFLAKAVTEDLAEGPAVDASAPGLDRLLVSRLPDRTYLYACSGSRVLVLTWTGADADLIPMAQQILAGK